MGEVYQKLAELGESDYYPYHMPGHKRNLHGDMPAQWVKTDITEIDGFDNLHQAEGLLLKAQKRASVLCHSDESYFLVNGSTCGILSAVSASIPFGGSILMARNCHKASYHAAYLRQLSIHYLYPEMNEINISEPVTASRVKAGMEAHPQCKAVLIVSPTYEGRIADVAAIAQVVHERNGILIVDEAHGAHLGFSPLFAKNSNQCGADLVIQSVHKTLPALTQSAVLHVNSDRVNRERLQRFLRIYQTSSPSYPLMAGIDNAMEIIEKQGVALFENFYRQFTSMTDILGNCKHLRILGGDRQDIGKLVIDTSTTNISGSELYQILLQRYHLQPEMAAPDYCLAMFTVADTPDGYERMTRALLEIDKDLVSKKTENPPARADADHNKKEQRQLSEIVSPCALEKQEKVKLSEAWDSDGEMVPLEQAIGRKAGDFVNLYPPGIPLLVPGEPMTGLLCEELTKSLNQGLNVQGIIKKDNKLWVKCLIER